MLRRAPSAANGNGTHEANGAAAIASLPSTHGTPAQNGEAHRRTNKTQTHLDDFRMLIDKAVNAKLPREIPLATVHLSKVPRELQIHVDSPETVQRVEGLLRALAQKNPGIRRAERDQWTFFFSNPGAHGSRPFRVGILPVLDKAARAMLDQHLAKVPAGLFENAGSALLKVLQAVGNTLQEPINGVCAVNPRYVAFYQNQQTLPSASQLLKEKRLPIALPAKADFPILPDYVVPPNDIELLPATDTEAVRLKAFLTALQTAKTAQPHADVLKQNRVSDIHLKRPERFAYWNHAITILPKENLHGSEG